MHKGLSMSFSNFKSLIRLIHPFSSNILSMVLDRPNKLAPLYISWLITYRCNCRCLHCSNRYDSPWLDNGDVNRELNTAEVIKVARQIGQSKIWGISLSGGEPLVREDIGEVVKILTAYGKTVNLCTNGEFLKEYVDMLSRLNVDTVSISMDSHEAKVHDYLRANPGLFQKALEGIEALKSKRRHKPWIKVRCAVSKKNCMEMEDYIKFWQDKADQIVFQPVQDSFIHHTHDEKLAFGDKGRDEMYKAFNEKMDYLIRQYRFMNNGYYKNISLFLTAPQELVQRKIFRCFSRSLYLSIDPYGSVMPCQGIRSQYIGNIKDEDIIALWRRPETFKFQRALRSRNCNCICWENSNFFNLYLVRFFNLVEKLFFWRDYQTEGLRIEDEVKHEAYASKEYNLKIQ